jgi:hypothetical protein
MVQFVGLSHSLCPMLARACCLRRGSIDRRLPVSWCGKRPVEAAGMERTVHYAPYLNYRSGVRRKFSRSASGPGDVARTDMPSRYQRRP